MRPVRVWKRRFVGPFRHASDQRIEFGRSSVERQFQFLADQPAHTAGLTVK